MPTPRSRLPRNVIGFLALFIAHGAAQAQPGTLTDLGPYAPGLAVNNGGQVALQNYLYSGGTLTAFPAGFTGAAINSAGHVAGSVQGNTGGNCPVVGLDQGGACAIGVYAGGTLTTFPIYNGSLDPAVGNQGQGINATDQVVGDWTFTHGLGGAILLSGGTFTPLDFPSNPCGGGLASPAGVAYAINDAGQIAGLLPHGADCVEHAFLLSGGLYTDLGAGAGLAINQSGVVAGRLQVGTVIHASLYNVPGSSAPVDLGTLAGDSLSWAYALNALSFVVGVSQYADPSPPFTTINHAMFYNGAMNDLNAMVSPSDPLRPYVSLTDARGINDTGLIVVNGVDSRTQLKHAYLFQAPLIKVSPGPLSFANQAVGTRSAAQAVTFTNVGATAIAVGAVGVSSNFTQTNGCGASLASGAACTAMVTYAPVAAGNPAGALTIVAAGVTLSVPLSGAAPLGGSIHASAASATTGTAVTLTWSSLAGESCVATGGSTKDGWTGSIAASGSKSVTESVAGTYTYGISCTAGLEVFTSTAAVVFSWPVVTASISASPTTVGALQPTTLTWQSSNATSCVGGGGGSHDGWASNGRSTSGSVSVTEPNPPTAGASETLTFTITCTSSVSNTSATASVNVVQNGPSPSHSGGGGIDLIMLVALTMLVCGRSLATQKWRPGTGIAVAPVVAAQGS